AVTDLGAINHIVLEAASVQHGVSSAYAVESTVGENGVPGLHQGTVQALLIGTDSDTLQAKRASSRPKFIAHGVVAIFDDTVAQQQRLFRHHAIGAAIAVKPEAMENDSISGYLQEFGVQLSVEEDAVVL